MVLDVAEVESDFSTGSDRVLVVAAFGEAFYDVGFSAEQPHERHYLFTAVADLSEERGEILRAGDEDLVFDCVGFELDLVDWRTKCVDDVVTRREQLVVGKGTLGWKGHTS